MKSAMGTLERVAEEGIEAAKCSGVTWDAESAWIRWCGTVAAVKVWIDGGAKGYELDHQAIADARAERDIAIAERGLIDAACAQRDEARREVAALQTECDKRKDQRDSDVRSLRARLAEASGKIRSLVDVKEECEILREVVQGMRQERDHANQQLAELQQAKATAQTFPIAYPRMVGLDGDGNPILQMREGGPLARLAGLELRPVKDLRATVRIKLDIL